MSTRLSKSRFTCGVRCPLQLWWRVHEPVGEEPDAETSDAVERNLAQEMRFAEGTQVGQLARTYVPGGELMPEGREHTSAALRETKFALGRKVKVLYEAAFEADGVFVAVDILSRKKAGWILTEVKSTTEVKEHHFLDAAIQTHILRRCGLKVVRIEVMHLNRACKFPDLSNLFTRTDVTAEVDALLPAIPAQINALRTMLAGPEPDAEPGRQCSKPYPCPYLDQCCESAGDDDVAQLYRVSSKRLLEFDAAGLETITEVPDHRLSDTQLRQKRALTDGGVVVDAGLRKALRAIKEPVAFLDFETTAPAIPVWDGCAPYDTVPVQFCCVFNKGRGKLEEHEWLADGPGDPRPNLARALLAACKGARSVVSYGASFERRCIEQLADALPRMRRRLRALAKRLVDLLPIVRNHVYTAEFHGGFSLKAVLPALVPECRYDELEIAGGGTATWELRRLLLDGENMPQPERLHLRHSLLTYCRMDTVGLAKIWKRLKTLSTRRKNPSGQGKKRRPRTALV